MDLGPVQMLVVGFEDGKFEGKILAELKRLREHDVIRIVDLLLVSKDDDGNVLEVEHSDLTQEESMEFGALAGALLGFGAAGEEGAEAGALAGAVDGADGSLLDGDAVWYLADEIPAGTTAAIALLEHRWAIPLRNAITEAGGQTIADEWIHPEDLIAAGAAAAS